MEATQLTKQQQYVRIGFLGAAFMIMFTSFNSLQNMISKVYDDQGYKNLGQIAIIVIYFTFAISTLFSSFIIKQFGYKITMCASSIGYAFFQACGLIIVLDFGLSNTVAILIVCIGAMACGIAASAIWVAQGAYTAQVASQQRKSELNGLFWGLMMSSQIWGNVLSTFLLGQVSQVVYFSTLTTLGFLSAALFLFLPNVNAQIGSSSQQTAIRQEVIKIFHILRDPIYKYLHIYYFFPGLTIAFYAGFLYKIIAISNQKQKQSESDYNKRLSQLQGYVFITLGLSQVFMGILMNLFSEKFNKFKIAIFGTLLVELAGFCSFIALFLKSFPLCFVSAFFWGCSDTLLQSNTNALTAQILPGKVQAFSVFRIIFALGVVIILLLSVSLEIAEPYIFLTIILVIQAFMTLISFNLLDLDVKISASLLSDESKSSINNQIKQKNDIS